MGEQVLHPHDEDHGAQSDAAGPAQVEAPGVVGQDFAVMHQQDVAHQPRDPHRQQAEANQKAAAQGALIVRGIE